jgi:hypothetical protein
MLLPDAHHAWPLHMGARAMRRLPTRRGMALSHTHIGSSLRAIRAVLERIDDDHELTALKIGLLGLLVLAAAALDCLWT